MAESREARSRVTLDRRRFASTSSASEREREGESGTDGRGGSCNIFPTTEIVVVVVVAERTWPRSVRGRKEGEGASEQLPLFCRFCSLCSRCAAPVRRRRCSPPLLACFIPFESAAAAAAAELNLHIYSGSAVQRLVQGLQYSAE